MKYAGFWIRVLAGIIDSGILFLLMLPIMFLLGSSIDLAGAAETGSFPASMFIVYLLPIVFYILFWAKKSATPGKMFLGLTILDANTGAQLTFGQSIIRYIGYIIASIPLCLGLVWAAFDKRKQGLHDKIAKTVVVYKNSI